jgi:excisionase family DNA binding protein
MILTQGRRDLPPKGVRELMENVNPNEKTGDKPKLFYRVGEAAKALGVSRSHMYDLIREGQLPSTRKFGVIMVPVAALRALAEEHAALGYEDSVASPPRSIGREKPASKRRFHPDKPREEENSLLNLIAGGGPASVDQILKGAIVLKPRRVHAKAPLCIWSAV